MYVRAYDSRGVVRDYVFEVDFETGAVTGRDAWEVNILLYELGDTLTMPWQQDYACPDPRHNPADMALFARWLRPDIEGPLAEYPLPEIEEMPEGAIS